MATVYLAQDLKHDRQVALKVMRPELSAILGGERFLREIRIAAKLNHPHILPLHDSGEADSFLYYVMPHIDGESLRQRLSRETQLSIDVALRITEEVASALDYAHRHDVIHRDIKPENILLHEGEAVVADFGIALAVRAAGGERLTETGLSLGTPAYMSPEQVVGEQQLDGRADIYSLACVLYEMLVGEPPFTGPNPQAVLARHMAATVPSITTVRSAVPQPVAAAIEKALGKAPADRYESASAFCAALFATEAQPEQKSIAVLPFANMSADPENEYFSDGISEEIINALTKLRDLRVAARTSSFTFKGKTADIKEVGSKLQVATVLEGSVRKAGNRLRITAQLINVADGYHLWSERYDRELDDVFAIQDEIAGAVVEQLKVSLLGAPEAGARAGHTDDLEAYELYLRGRYSLKQRGPGVQKALEYFQQAVERDPEYALAHAGMAQAYAVIGATWGKKRHDAFPRGKAATLRALELDPQLALAHACLGYIAFWYDWDWALAERELLRAIELDPQEADAHFSYGFYLGYIKGDWDAAIQRLRHARALDPLSVVALAQVGAALIQCGRPEEGLVELERALEVAPESSAVHWYRGMAYRRLSRYEEATVALERAISLSGGQLFALGDLAVTHVKAGRLDQAQAILDEGVLCEEQPLYAAIVYGAMGNSDAAFEMLDRAYEQRDGLLPMRMWQQDVQLNWDDPRHQDLMRRLALP
jgi:serine/threonine-protein kinase